MDIFEKLRELSAQGKGSYAGKPEYIIAGLGNPGVSYGQTRHNAGFIVADRLCEKLSVKCDRAKFSSLYCEAMISGKKCIITKPQTFMNNSGEAVVQWLDFYKLPIERLIVVYDDISLEPSRLRIRRKGSDGGHNGIKSIIQLTGEEGFPRIKIGIGNKPHPDYSLADWVLSRFSSDEMKLIADAAEKACRAIELITDGRIDSAMNLFN